MKMAMTALAVLLLAAPAVAQDRGGGRGDRGDRQERMEQRDRPHRDGAGGGRPQRDRRGERERHAPVPAPQAPQAAAPAQADEGARFRGDGRFERRRDDRGPGVDQRRGGGEAQRGDHRRGDRRQDWSGRRDDDRRDWNGRSGDRRDHGRRDQDGRDWDRRGDHRDWDRRGDGRRDDHRRWERGRYPPAYSNSHRYRHSWRPPSGFYHRSWSFGEFLPRAWYGPGYWIVDAWRYDLPLPPPGYDWVRSGPDALLIDQFSGRIVQVVRDVFWY